MTFSQSVVRMAWFAGMSSNTVLAKSERERQTLHTRPTLPQHPATARSAVRLLQAHHQLRMPQLTIRSFGISVRCTGMQALEPWRFGLGSYILRSGRGLVLLV